MASFFCHTVYITFITFIYNILAYNSNYYYVSVYCIGGVFEHEIEQQVRAVLRQAVEDVNSNRYLLPGIRLQFDVEFIPAHDSFAASRAGNSLFTLVSNTRCTRKS